MPEAMESDVLRDPCCCNPVFQWLAGHAPFQTFEYFSRSTIAHKLYGFIAEWQLYRCFCLLNRDYNTQADSRNRLYMLLSQVLDVADA